MKTTKFFAWTSLAAGLLAFALGAARPAPAKAMPDAYEGWQKKHYSARVLSSASLPSTHTITGVGIRTSIAVIGGSGDAAFYITAAGTGTVVHTGSTTYVPTGTSWNDPPEGWEKNPTLIITALPTGSSAYVDIDYLVNP